MAPSCSPASCLASSSPCQSDPKTARTLAPHPSARRAVAVFGADPPACTTQPAKGAIASRLDGSLA